MILDLITALAALAAAGASGYLAVRAYRRDQRPVSKPRPRRPVAKARSGPSIEGLRPGASVLRDDNERPVPPVTELQADAQQVASLLDVLGKHGPAYRRPQEGSKVRRPVPRRQMNRRNLRHDPGSLVEAWSAAGFDPEDLEPVLEADGKRRRALGEALYSAKVAQELVALYQPDPATVSEREARRQRLYQVVASLRHIGAIADTAPPRTPGRLVTQ